MIDRPTRDPRVSGIANSPTRPKGIGPWWATRRSRSPSRRKMEESNDSHRRAAFSATASRTGWTSVGELEMMRRISAVAVCCSRASIAERCTSAYDGAGWVFASGCWRGVPHSSQNLAATRFSCWQRGHVMPEPPSGRVGEGSELWAETNRPRPAWSRTLAHSVLDSTLLTERAVWRICRTGSYGPKALDAPSAPTAAGSPTGTNPPVLALLGPRDELGAEAPPVNGEHPSADETGSL